LKLEGDDTWNESLVENKLQEEKPVKVGVDIDKDAVPVDVGLDVDVVTDDEVGDEIDIEENGTGSDSDEESDMEEASVDEEAVSRKENYWRKLLKLKLHSCIANL
jgi:hypothetical protein